MGPRDRNRQTRGSPSNGRRRRSQREGRAQSGVIGYVLIIGMVIASATLIAFTGASVMDQYRELVGQESTTNAIEEIDTELSSVASVGGLTRAEFSIGDAEPSQYRIVRSGHINVTADRNASCRAHIPLSSLRYERDDGVVVGYEAGGIWRQQGGLVSQTVMHTPPDVTFESGTLSMRIINVSGSIEGPENIVYENVSESFDTNRAIQDSLFQGECARPDNVTISVTSDFYRGWDGYFQSSINATSHTRYDSNHTTQAYLDQDKLPVITDDDRNDVVDLTNESDFNDVTTTNNTIEVNKSANNTYTTIVTPLSSGSTQVGEIRVVEDDVAFRPPLDVVFVVDESGSMLDGTKIEDARDAAKAFVGEMNSSYDRAGVVGFDGEEEIKITANGEYITDDFGGNGVNGSISMLSPDSPWSSTDMGAGIHGANVMYGLTSNSSRNKVMILLGDGSNNDGSDPECNSQSCLNRKAFDEAEIANKDGITIHTVGFGNLDANANQTLEDIAQTAGGTYHYAANSGDLTGIFVDLFSEISASKQIVREPISLRMAAGGTTYYPQIDGDASHVARNGTDGEINLNDPTAPSNFSFSIDISDGENVSMTALNYTCESWERTGFVERNTTTGQQYAEVRCAEIDDSTPPTEVSPTSTSVYTNGSDVSSLLDQPTDWWDDDLRNETLAPYLGGADNETLLLESNEAIVVFEFGSGGSTDRLIVKYQIGQSTTDAVPKQIFNIEVRYLVIGDDS